MYPLPVASKLIGVKSLCLFSRAAIALIPHIVGGCGNRTRSSVAKGHVGKTMNAKFVLQNLWSRTPELNRDSRFM
jgi:hypothetical protein